MTALFTPLLFTAHSGTVHFEGRPLSELTAVRAGVHIRRACLDAPRLKAWIYHVAHEQLFAAQAQAKAQRTNHTSASPVVNAERGEMRRPLGRESAR